MRRIAKLLIHRVAQLVVMPLVVGCKLEEKLIPGHVEVIFHCCTQSVSILPGIMGVILRRAFYSLTLEECSVDCHIGFGSLFSHRANVVKQNVYIGNYSLIGTANLGERCLIGSRVSIVSGKHLHALAEDGSWTPFSPDRLKTVSIGNDVWVGEGAIILADVGEGCLVGAGAVVTSDVEQRVVVAGNPARNVRKVE